MKKLLGFVGALCLFMGTAHAACVITSCGGRGNDCINAYSLEVKPEGRVAKNEVYICGKNHCQNGTIIHDYALDKFYMCVIASDAGVNFMWMGDDTWEEYPVSTCSDPSDGYILNPDPNATKALRNSTDRTETLRKNDTGSVVLQTGSNICIEYKCNPGYMPNDDETACVLDTRESDCTSTGGTWTGSECTCDQGKNITQSTNGKSCVCISSDYEPDGVNGCKKTAAAIAADQQRQQDADNRSRKEACVNSGGVWTGSACTCDASKNLRVQNNVCVCLDDENYKRSGDRCVLTDAAALRQKCESATGAYWDGVSCQCYEPNYSFNGTVCREDPAITECKSISGARWANGKCVCNQSGYVPNYQTKQCEKSAATLQAEQAVAAQQKIDQAVATLNTIRDGLRVNKWRNEEGKFNTSRLLSDSIAGVVLGTAGGLITSSVVKKSQVSDGFEDMQCTVGGQVVAGWGDEFRVGIQ